ncbi:type II toxin-antitoxin system RelE/ParE family toxin [Nonomuraea sp. NPDC049141]|uniref:type II toxin-antitoxin system RelE/ParE family toxin n=1 Tax=unclassified Nonomuraea TaxID=2593643 RepID=UPI0033F69A53
MEKLSAESFARAAFYIDLLAAEGPLLGEPYTRQLDGKLRELRFYLDDLTMRISYREVDRARRALSRCKDKAHSADEEW